MRLSKLPIVVTSIVLTSSLTLATACNVMAQVSGVPGDGVPDFYYFVADGTASTSFGLITRPAGTLTVDTDGTDMSGVAVSGMDVSQPPACDLCEGGFLPGSLSDPLEWSVQFDGTATRWTLVLPMDSDGFVGVIGEYGDPLGIFPEFVLANYGLGLGEADFPRIFNNGAVENWNVEYLTSTGHFIYTNITFVPEPSALLIAGLACFVLATRVRSPAISGLEGRKEIAPSVRAGYASIIFQ